MADPTSITSEAAVSAGPSKRRLVFARIRQWLAVALLAESAVQATSWQIRALRDPDVQYFFDPAPVFFWAAVVGLALRAFWARYLAICFTVALLSIRFFWPINPVDMFVHKLPILVLLSGATMRSLFEERGGRLNHWTAGLDQRVARLRVLFVAQSVALGLIFAARHHLSPMGIPVIVLAGVAIVGLVFHRTWGLLCIAPAIGLEAYLVVAASGARIPYLHPPAWSFSAMLFVACVASLAAVFPLLRALGQRVRGSV